MVAISTNPLKTIEELHKHNSGISDDVVKTISDIKANVQANGDKAIAHYAKLFDDVEGELSIQVSKEEIKAAYANVPPAFIEAIKRAIANIEAFHKRQIPRHDPQNIHEYFKPNAPNDSGIKSGVRYSPVESAGLYVPGGRAPLPSTILMNAIPAKVAGVETLVVATPPQSDGTISPQILVAADLCGVDNIYKVGGAQAIFSLTYGTETIPKVDKIVGPGNVYVTAAKKMVFGEVGIDKLAGPSEVLVLIDEIKYASSAAIELLAQLEHDPLAIAVVVSEHKNILEAIQHELTALLPTCSRQDILKVSINNTGLLLANGTSNAIELTNRYAPEHLVILSDKASEYLPKIKHAGSIFMGPYTPVALGDFYAGPNHVLPTSGTSRFSSPLGVLDFMKYSSVLEYSKSALQKASKDLDILTEMEGLDAHYKTVTHRLNM